jgi:signal transduction histidine kinase
MVLGAFFLLAIWLDPSEPSRYSEITYSILAVYLGYAAVLASATWRWDRPTGRMQIITQAFDMMVFAVILFFTEGATSPFFVYFIFLLICATLRWQWRGTLWTAFVALTTVIFLAFYPTGLIFEPDFELNRFVIRIVYLAVLAVLVGYLGAHEQKLRGDLSSLAGWPHSFPAEFKKLLQEMLEKVATILGAPRIVLAWEAEEEPWLHVASWQGGEFQYSREPPSVFGTSVADPLKGSNFFCTNALSPQPMVVRGSPKGIQRWQGPPLDPDLRTRFHPKSVLALGLHGKKQDGYLFAFDKRGLTPDDLVLGEIVASSVAVRMENFLLLKQLLGTAASEERIRLARDLHDGLLQSLTGAALQMETVRRLMETDPEAAQQLLVEIQQLIAAEQRDLRLHVRELKPSIPDYRGEDPCLAPRLENLAKRIERHWGLQVEIHPTHLLTQIPARLAQEIYFLVHESLVNAARHAGAKVIQAKITIQGDDVGIEVSDDGHGFSFRGRYDHAALVQLNIGPATLRERVTSLGGSLVVDSTDRGSRLEITLPIRDSEV